MTTQELLDLTFRYVGRRKDATPGLRLLYLNEAQRDLSIDFFFDELETLDDSLITAVNKPDYDAPGDDYIIEQMKNLGSVTLSPPVGGSTPFWAPGMWVGDGECPPVASSSVEAYALDERDWDWYNAEHSESTDFRGPPDIWTMRQGRIHFDPTPDSLYVIRVSGRRLPASLSVSPAVGPTLPVDWHLILAMQASADLLFLFGNDARAMILKNEYLGKISTKQEKRTLRRVRESGQMKVQFANPLRRSRGRRNRRRRIFEDAD